MASAPKGLTDRVGSLAALRLSPGAALAALRLYFAAALEQEWDLRRPFLWLPAAAGAGAIYYLVAPTEPVLWVVGATAVLFAALAFLAHEQRTLSAVFVILAALAAGEFSGGWRAARVDAPVLDRIYIGELAGFVEEVDFRPQGARFLLRVTEAERLAPEQTPYRVRLTMRGVPAFAAGDFLTIKARLLPPARAALPGGYDFARDAYFQRIGAVGNVLGKAEALPAPRTADWRPRLYAAVDRARNALALRVYDRIGGDNGAIAAAMVTGKRDLLSEAARETIAKAGIFHIITISGVQMTLVAGIFFVGFRGFLALFPALALNYPIKKWSAALAMLGALAYGLFTGSRVGSERALFMTLILLGAVIAERPALSMRNLAFAALAVIAWEPEALLGASFQLSFAAVAALIAVYESRGAASGRPNPAPKAVGTEAEREARGLADHMGEISRLRVFGALAATFCATSATASFMAYDFHELNPYVLIGNPLTLAMIELFAVPAALLGALLAPFGADGLVWSYLGAGVGMIMTIARWIGSAPGATIALPAFAPWSIACLTLAVLSAVLWRTRLMKLTALPLVGLGLLGAASGQRFDLAVAPTGEYAALRDAGGRLALLGKRRDSFAAEQWLRADADLRPASEAEAAGRCDTLGCVGVMRNGEAAALVLDGEAFHEDCARAQVVISPLYAPSYCTPKILLDRRKLRETGAVTLAFGPKGMEWRTTRAPGEDRPWSRAPRRRALAPLRPAAAPESPATKDDSRE
ncbi:competence protein ComEC family protein [Rhodoblastus acidophilus]|uniref:Competence protein ComEC family protein n=1 Tax=Candidatus Rhodoblastus alkanivorans TaxID=2954117 RepID=A0ABS9Z7N6_9HYPH|nr:ComEC/Rec2 family competence protein [Candidatus Rhodoblastus alkanivorans]MCI4680430.1 competence protein ComEC family protein [Candidatus Rhodoblastus alkanivorans]MCI4683207.1 competence protein ComEC family protein [Candidatus Rhodoblastus alkanivorans]MDI4640519.1 competence protein ComEC family protein [Rhodoblastus acidophilus]